MADESDVHRDWSNHAARVLDVCRSLRQPTDEREIAARECDDKAAAADRAAEQADAAMEYERGFNLRDSAAAWRAKAARYRDEAARA